MKMSLAMTVVAALATGCVKHYKPPTSDEPHAVLKFRRAYEESRGVSLREILALDDHRAVEKTISARRSKAPQIDAVLVHPRSAHVQAASTFFHTEMRQVQESYQESKPHYTTESYSCGTVSSPRTCTRGVTRYTYETKYRWVTKAVEVVDGACSASVWLAPSQDGVYLLEFTYRGHRSCRLSCYEQLSQSDGTFENQACPVPSPEEMEEVAEPEKKASNGPRGTRRP